MREKRGLASRLRDLHEIRRRKAWLLDGLSFGRLLAGARAAAGFAMRRERAPVLPLVLKIDVSPLCNLRCTICVHADPEGDHLLEEQHFTKDMRMSPERYGRILDEVKGKTAAISMFYLGDPLAHPRIVELCRMTAAAGINSHITSNFSFRLSDEKLHELVTSGLTHLTVGVDGLTQENYQRTRVGGDIELVLRNLERVCALRKEARSKYPRIEVQYIKFRHNEHEWEEALRRFAAMGVDQVSSFWGDWGNYTEEPITPDDSRTVPPRRGKLLPRCLWPYFAMVVKYDGDVVPCCQHRLGTQYQRAKGRSRALGNVFETSVAEVWNSEPYRAARRLATDPTVVEREPELKEHFCHACPVLFDVLEELETYSPRDHAFEDYYRLDERGRPVRLPRS